MWSQRTTCEEARYLAKVLFGSSFFVASKRQALCRCVCKFALLCQLYVSAVCELPTHACLWPFLIAA
jgi:hypothetical protein